MSIHIGAKEGEIADFMLLPGDPMRAKYIAENFLENPVCYNQIRGMLGFTGLYKGKRVSVQGSGMGIPSHMIYVNELASQYHVKTIIRVGSCGALVDSVQIRDLILAVGASTDSHAVSRHFEGGSFAPIATFELAVRAAENAKKMGLTVKAGNILSSDVFYDDPALGDVYEKWRRYGVLAVEMEAAGLYTLAARLKFNALTLLTVSDHLLTKEALSAGERQSTFNSMVELALSLAE